MLIFQLPVNPPGQCTKEVATADYLIRVVDNNTTDIYVENKTENKIKLLITISKINNQNIRDEFTSQVTLQSLANTIRNISNALENTLCIINIEVVNDDLTVLEPSEIEDLILKTVNANKSSIISKILGK